MATGWIKSLHCKSRASDDVVPNHHYHHLLPNSASCKKSVQSLKDVVETTKEKKISRKPKPPESPPSTAARERKRSVSRLPEPVFSPTQPVFTPPDHRARSIHRHVRSSSESTFFPALTELPEGHPSRNVVEIIFHTSWVGSGLGRAKSFPGRVEMMFKVQNQARTVARFEEYRENVKKRAGLDPDPNRPEIEGIKSGSQPEDHARCVADGNEVMRFYCLGPTSAFDARAWELRAAKGTTAICTFSGSGEAHERSGSGSGRRAMLVCRVIAGRVCKELGLDSLIHGRVGFDSVSGDNGELIVFDSRAVLPCFLIIYKL